MVNLFQGKAATRIMAIFTLLILSVTITYGQKFKPLKLAKKIFGKDSPTNIGEYVTGEYEGKPNGQFFPKDVTTIFSLLGQTDKKAVVAMNISPAKSCIDVHNLDKKLRSA